MYRLQYDPGVEAAHDTLSADGREALTRALADACDDPVGATSPYGLDEPQVRQVVVEGAVAVLFLSHQSKTLHVTQITPLP